MKKYLPVLYILLILIGVPLLFKAIPYSELKDFREQDYSKVFYDREGQLLQVTSVQDGIRKEFTAVKEVPAWVKNALVKAEDQRFYWHHGIDYSAISLALVQNKIAGRTVRGGSTITMQVAKILNSSNAPTITRKLQDMVNAYRIEAKLTKNQILELYINNLYFGSGVYGITSAARTFYGKELNQISKEEACFLAILPRNPSFYNPINYKDRCCQRAYELYKSIYKKSSLPFDDFCKACPKQLFNYPFEFPHLIRYLQSNPQLLKQANNSNVYKLSVNLELQQQAQRFLNEALEQAANSRISNGALLLLENSTGNVLAWIGNGNFFDNLHNGQIDGVIAKNQPGSSMKPFLYALGLESKNNLDQPLFTPNSVLADIPTEFGNEKLYIPFNFNNRFHGPVKMRIALASSLNVPAVSMLNIIGVQNYLNKLDSMGFHSLKQNGIDADLGLALGAAPVRLSELVPAFSVFTRDGYYFPLNFLLPENSDSEKKPQSIQVYSADTCRIIDSFLSDKSARALGFGYTQTFQTTYPSIFKTGTSNQYQDIVALGATKEYTIGIWMGNFSGQTVIGKTGSSLPAWVAKNMLDYLEKGKENSTDLNFDEPEGFEKIKICSLSGMAAGNSCPASVYEYVPKSDNSKQKDIECTWHYLNNGQLNVSYPPEYQQWLRQNNIPGTVAYNQAPLYFQTPQNNALFYYSQANKDKQAIPVEVFGGQENKLFIYYDQIPMAPIERPFSFSLPVEKGHHIIKVICGQEEKSLEFDVR